MELSSSMANNTYGVFATMLLSFRFRNCYLTLSTDKEHSIPSKRAEDVSVPLSSAHSNPRS